MKKLLLVLAVIVSQISFAQDKGTIKGTLLDKDMDNEPLAFANVVIKGTSIGITTEMDGTYSLSLDAGSYVVQFSFLGYKTIEVPVTLKAGETVTINRTLESAEGVALDEVKIKASTSREKESALLVEQKKATVIKESIGAQRLSQIGVSNAATATTKISGVTKSEGSGDIYIRGLGDRYLSTTMNGLTVPSDDVQNKNIDLGLFGTGLINNVGISKTYATSSYSDQASGNVDVVSKRYARKTLSVSASSGFNTAVVSYNGDFKKSIMRDDVTFGFHEKKYALTNLILNQGWDPLVQNSTANYNVSLTAAQKFKIFGKDLAVFFTGSHGQSFEYQEGFFKSYRANVLDNEFNTESFITNFNTNAYIRGDFKINDKHKIAYNTLFVNKGVDNVYEQGRDGLGYVFDQQPQENGAFVRDQNYKQTRMFVNQLMGEHKTSEKNLLKWAAGYNFVLAEEPNRIRNEGNIIDDQGTFTYAFVGDFQQRKSSQRIQDDEYTSFVENQYSFGEIDEDENRPFKFNVGANYRYKERTFKSQFIGVSSRNFTVSSVDNISDTYVIENFNTSAGQPELIKREQQPDRYNADLTFMAGYTSLDFGLNKKFSGNIGVRYERNEINVLWDVNNFVGRIGSTSKEYTGVYPSVNLKYELSEKNFVRFASSLTQTLPEFKEVSPFEYVSPTGRVVKGNPDLERSKVFNMDAKWEFFPEREALISATVFYKNIQDPINLAQARGSAGIFQYFNTGENASIFGLELEGRFNLIKNEEEQSILSANANLTQMWFNQDLFENYQYFGKTESDLQGASDFILNGSFTYNNRAENEFIATLTGNYSSDKVFALGSPEDFANSTTLFNDEIIEKGFVTLDMVVSKKFSEKLSLKLTGRNLLNPKIQQSQLVTVFDANDNIISQTNETVQSYKKGSQISLGVTYKF